MVRTTIAKVAAAFLLGLASVNSTYAQTVAWSAIDCSKSDIILDGITRCEKTSP